MLNRLLRWVRLGALLLGMFLGYFVLAELALGYRALYRLHPVLGGAFAALALAGLTALLVWLVVSWLRHPTVLRPPTLVRDAAGRPRHIGRYGRYLARLSGRLCLNTRVPVHLRDRLRDAVAPMLASLASGADRPRREAVERFEREALDPALQALDAQADAEVRRCVRDVMLGVTLSPWHSLDVILALYRNLTMVVRIASVYDNRPPLRDTLAILRDVAAVVAALNIMSFGSRLMRNLSASVPLLGRFADDVAQGIGAGLFTSVTGHAAMLRCHCYRGWNREEAQETILGRLGGFMRDIKLLVRDTLLPQLRRPLENQVADGTASTEVFERARRGVLRAVDETTTAMEAFVRRPVSSATQRFTRGSVAAGVGLTRGMRRSALGLWQGTCTSVYRAGVGGAWLAHAAARPFRSLGRRDGTRRREPDVAKQGEYYVIDDTLRKMETRLERLPDAQRRELEPLMEQLREELLQLAEGHLDSAHSIAGFAELSAHEATRGERSSGVLKHSISGLGASVHGLEATHPKLVEVVNRICDALASIGV